jgi:WD40 repeat protein
MKRRICSLKHENARVLQWRIMQDGKLIVTIASDYMVRVWDIYAMDEKTPGKLICSFPMQSKATSLTVSEDNSIFIGDDFGELLALKIEVPEGQ